VLKDEKGEEVALKEGAPVDDVRNKCSNTERWKASDNESFGNVFIWVA